MISHNSSITLALKPGEKDDYLHLSVVRGPGKLDKDCVIDLPFWADFEFSAVGTGVLTHLRDRVRLRIPAGPPVWQLKITCPCGLDDVPTGDYIVLGDSENIPNGG